MRIDSSWKPQALENGASGQKPGSTRKDAAAPAAGNDLAHWSEDTARVNALAAQVNSLPEIRQERVQSLSQAIRDGRYQVTPEQTAASLVDEIIGRVA
jgi:flagellar biosynthesis anti-sigma factor FlgM